MNLKTFILKDELKHHKYNWPKTLLQYPRSFENGLARQDSINLVDQYGRQVPFQFINRVLDGEDIHYFYKVFKKEKMCTPLQYRAVALRDKNEL